jgi:Ca-activated chloride channel family protein
MPGKLRLDATWNLDPLPATDAESLAYLLLDILEDNAAVGDPNETQNPKSKIQNPLNLSLVLDTSGSMGGAKLQNLKSAVKWVIEYLGADDRIAVTLFDDEVHPLIPNTPVTQTGGLAAQVDAVREAGGTAMSKGLLVGLDEAMKGRAPGTVSRIIVLTDGQTWGDADKCRQLASQAGAEGIPITALGVGAEEDWSIDLLDDMAQQSGGQSGYIARPEEISSAFEGTVLAMQQAVARNLRLTITPSRGVSVRAVYRAAPIISKLWPGAGNVENSGESLVLPLGDNDAGSGQTLLFEVMLPPRKPGQYRLAHLMLEYETTGGTATQREQAALDLVVHFSMSARRGPGNPRVMNSVEKTTTFKLQTRALQASEAGDVAAATRNLRAAATRLLNIGETELAEATEREAQLLETAGKMSAAGTKKLVFDTRKLAVVEAEVGGGESATGNQEEVAAPDS